jgi:predicted ester cyclase
MPSASGSWRSSAGRPRSAGVGREGNRQIVRRLVDEVVNQGRVEVIDELFAPEMVETAREWFGPFRSSFPDVHMDIVDLIAEEDRVAGRFLCSATHLGDWRGHAPTGRRFENVDEVYFFWVADGRITGGWGIEDTLDRLSQLGLPPG